ncbi:hypothetical protein M0802_001573 [Mischocyttarus mexicanus]|nr:hypothetical protein M0802_001573 [Mischocyttarus mexicanus]
MGNDFSLLQCLVRSSTAKIVEYYCSSFRKNFLRMNWGVYDESRRVWKHGTRKGIVFRTKPINDIRVGDVEELGPNRGGCGGGGGGNQRGYLLAQTRDKILDKYLLVWSTDIADNATLGNTLVVLAEFMCRKRVIDSGVKVDPLLDGGKEVEDTLANNYRVRAEPDVEGETEKERKKERGEEIRGVYCIFVNAPLTFIAAAINSECASAYRNNFGAFNRSCGLTKTMPDHEQRFEKVVQEEEEEKEEEEEGHEALPVWYTSHC